jgi:hypothetical protein
MAEVYANAIPRTLTADITSGATSLSVSAATGFPASGNFSIKIEDEIIRVGAISGTTLSSLTRGAESTTAAAHTTGAVVLHVITKTALDNIIIEAGGPIVFPAGTKKTFSPDATLSGLNVGSLAGNPISLANGDLWYNSSGNALNARINGATVSLGAGGGSGATISTGTDASKTGTPAGDLYLPNNGFQLYRYTGSASAPWGPVFPFTAPDNSAFSDHNSPTVVTTQGGIFISTAASAGDQNRLRVRAVPGATPYTTTIAFIPRFIIENFHNCGLYVTNGTALIGLYVGSDSGVLRLKVDKWTNSTTFSANAANLIFTPTSGVIFLRYTDDGTNRLLSYSLDGQNFEQIFSEGRTTFLTATNEGFGVHVANGTRGTGMTLLSYART